MHANGTGSRAIGLLSFAIRILLVSLVVGLALSWLGIDPKAILRGSWDAILAAPRAVGDAVAWTLPHILTGAVIVVPVAAVILLLRMLGGRSRRPPPPGAGPAYRADDDPPPG